MSCRAANLPWRIRFPEIFLPRVQDARQDGDWPDLVLRPASKGFESERWNDFVHTWHYPPTTRLCRPPRSASSPGGGDLPGLHVLRCRRLENRSQESLDRMVRRTAEEEPQLAANNSHFLILPWNQSKNLASMLLGMAARCLQDDWQERYHYESILPSSLLSCATASGELAPGPPTGSPSARPKGGGEEKGCFQSIRSSRQRNISSHSPKRFPFLPLYPQTTVDRFQGFTQKPKLIFKTTVARRVKERNPDF